DLRKDFLIIEMIKYIAKLLNVNIRTYSLLLTNHLQGIISIRKGITMYKLKNDNSKKSRYTLFKKSDFLISFSFYLVFAYVFGVGDRNEENMMVTVGGDFFHIDFGYIFGDDPKKFMAPLHTIPEIVCDYLDSDMLILNRFLSIVEEFYLKIRHNIDHIVSHFDFIKGNPCVSLNENDVMFVKRRLMCGINDIEAGMLFLEGVKENIRSKKLKIYCISNEIGRIIRKIMNQKHEF
ncbi:putative phosphatidylinositol 3-kinase VPS34 like protein, partial [Dictyocoela roeselum]